jgi:hypothetical protein
MTENVLPTFEFADAARFSIDERFENCISKARAKLAEGGLQEYFDAPMIPAGASEAELRKLEADLGIELPNEFRKFLTLHRYLLLGDGMNIGGLDHDGVHHAEHVWVSTDHASDVNYLVFGAYWAYADGDQLMFDLSKPTQPIVVYLHEHGPRIEPFAPSFSLALWRLVSDMDDEGADLGDE